MKSIRQFSLSLAKSALCLSFLIPAGYSQIEDPIPESIDRGNIVIQIEEFTQIPASAGSAPLARINHLKPAGDGSGRVFVNDLNGLLYLVSKDNASVYLDFGAMVGDLATSPGLGTGFTSFAFHPDFAANGKFYTAHMAPSGSGPADFTGPVVEAPIALQGVILEWTATNSSADTFEGTSREVLRIDLTHTIHGLQEISFNPNSQNGDSDYGMLYICVGDAGTTIQGFPDNAHRLDSVLGTILRIDPMGSNSANGQYGIPGDNPWASDGDPNTFGEIWSYGFRNPHRISWDIAGDGKMLSGDIGERNIEEVNLIEPGLDYGWNLREGTFVINPDFDQNPQNGTRDEVFALPANDESLGFTYPVAQYDHDEGQAIVSGYVYRGSAAPLLDGYFLFGDIVNGRLFSVDADSLTQGTQASIKELTLEIDGSSTTLLSLVSDSRVDLRFGYDEENELYLIEKRQGKVYKIAGAKLASSGGGEPPVVGWQKIDDLENGLTSAWTIFQEEGNFQAEPSVTVVDDPLGAGQGKVLAVNPGVPLTTSSLNMTVERTLSESQQIVDPVTESQLTTFYFKVGRPTVSGAPGEVDVTWGLAAESARSGETGLHAYGSYSVLGRYEANGIMDIRDGGSYVDLANAALNTNVYYEAWFVVDHFNNTFSQYLKGGTDFPEQTMVYSGAGYRNLTFDNLETLLIITSAGTIDAVKGKDDIYFDDFHIDVSGQNLTTPLSLGGGHAEGGKLINISTRAKVGTGDNVLIGGFIVGGNESVTVLIRAVGSELLDQGVAAGTFLADPQIQLFSGGQVIATNDNWDADDAAGVMAAGQQVAGFQLVAGSLSAGLVIDLAPGAYGAIVTGADGGTGICLVEVYEVE